MKQKKFLILVMSILIALSCAACEQQEAQLEQGNDKIKIVTTVFPPYDFAKVIAKDRAEIVMLLKPGVESHSYEPSPQDIIAIKECDLFIYGGGESDAWVEDILEGIDKPEEETCKMMESVYLLEESLEHKGHKAGEEEYDEHIWTSPVNAIHISQAIEEKICQMDSPNEKFYRQNAKEYIKELEKLDQSFWEWREKLSNPVLIFGDRFPFLYFANEYTLECHAAFPGCSTETEPSAKTMAFLIDQVRQQQLEVVFHLELSNTKVAEAIAEAGNAKTAMLHSCHNISKEEMEQGVTYLSLMKQNLEVLKESSKCQY